MSLEPATMKAAILVAQRRPLEIDEVTLPDRLEAGQVLVKLHASGICGSQLGEIDGVKGPDRHLPHLLGHEGTATVLEIGPGVQHVQPQQRIVLHWRKGAGIEAAPPVYRWRNGRLNAGWVTTFNEYAVVSENRMTPIPADVDLDVAVLLGCPVTTGLGVVSNDARLTLGESIVVLGTGGVGLAVVQGAALLSAHPVVAVDRFENRLDLARQLGATHTVNTSEPDYPALLRRLVGSVGADVVVDNTGHPDLIRLAYELTHTEGRTILVGVPREDDEVSLHTLPLHFGKVLTGSHGGGTRPERDIPRYLRLHAAGRLSLRPWITNRYPLEDINQAIEQLRDGGVAGRCLIEFDPT
jgi:S-(hydroxymethyl)glutathione dehydrogenase/alcohol dehydrogenase